VALRSANGSVSGSTPTGQGVGTINARAVAAWSGACLLIVLVTTNPAYKALVLAAAFVALAASVGLNKMRTLVVGIALIATFAALLNFASAHLGRTVLFALPDAIPALGGPYTLEALAFGASSGITIAAAILAAAPFSLLLSPHDVMDALPAALARTGTAIAASMNLVPSVADSFVLVSEAQRLRGWQPRGPRSWADVVVPVVLTSVEGSIQLAESMEARGFASGRRTQMQAAKTPQLMSLVLVAASAVAVVLFAAAQIWGWSADWYPYPSLTWPGIDLLPLLACCLLFAPVLTWRSRT
jgi:energy-coupling factor transport system permease protein